MFKQFREDRIIKHQVMYLGRFRLYVLNYCSVICDEDKNEINLYITRYIEKYVELFTKEKVLARIYMTNILIAHYEKQIDNIKIMPTDYSIEFAMKSQSME